MVRVKIKSCKQYQCLCWSYLEHKKILKEIILIWEMGSVVSKLRFGLKKKKLHFDTKDYQNWLTSRNYQKYWYKKNHVTRIHHETGTYFKTLPSRHNMILFQLNKPMGWTGWKCIPSDHFQRSKTHFLSMTWSCEYQCS